MEERNISIEVNFCETIMQADDDEEGTVEPFAFYTIYKSHEAEINGDIGSEVSTTREFKPRLRLAVSGSENHFNVSPSTVMNFVADNDNSKPKKLLSSKTQGCKVCGKVLSSTSSYYVHMKSHSDNKPYQCTICDASFCRKPYLDVHMRTHTGERPFKCEMCEKRFTQKSSLNTHKRVHTGERPYACDICNKRFAVKSYVTAHRWTHLSDKSLVCERCNINFSSKHQFATHLKLHSKSANFECHMCGKVFSRNCFLIRHQNKVHRAVFTCGNPSEDVVSSRSPVTVDVSTNT